jgi:hypothetical protein
MMLIWHTIHRGAKSIFAFVMVFIVLQAAFGMLVHVIYGSQDEIYSTYFRTMATLTVTLLGDVSQYESMSAQEPYITPIFFVSYMFLMFFIILNIFVAILNEAFSVVVEHSRQSKDKDLVKNALRKLVEEVKIFIDLVKYKYQNCCKRSKSETSKAFKKFGK